MTDVAAKSESNNAVEHHDHHDHHPTERQYWIVFVALAVLTAIEVLWSYLGLSGPALVVPLVVMMLIKFVLVAGAFMHLYFDMKIKYGGLFMWTFVGGLALAVLVYAAAISAFQWHI